MSKQNDLIIDQLETLLENLASRKHIAQAIIAVESGDGSFKWMGAKGLPNPDGTPIQPNTPFFIASIDKLLNAAIIMMLSERDRLELSDPIANYLPRSLLRGIHRFNGIDYSERITISHLLSHTSGLADWLEDSPKRGKSLIQQLLCEGDRAIEIDELTHYVSSELYPHFAPQDPFSEEPIARYSDTNFILLIAVIEAVTGKSLREVHDDFLYRPLEMRNTFFLGTSQPLDDTLEPVTLRYKGEPLEVPLFLRSARSVYSTAGDLISFLRRLMDGQIFQTPRTLELMQQCWNRFKFSLDPAALRSPGWPIEYGLGIMRFRLPRIFNPFHPMPSVIGHTGSTGCWSFYCKDLDIFTSGSVDEVTAGAVPYRIVPKILRVLARPQ